MKKIVLTGGPCGGKSTVLSNLKEEMGDQLVIVPEVATTLLENAVPVPDKDVEWTVEWQEAFQQAILSVQISLEKMYSIAAEQKGAKIIVCDRGLLDGASFLPSTVEEFCQSFGLDKQEALDRYEMIIHLESLAHSWPERYGQANNGSRFHSLQRAVEIEKKTIEVWQDHPNRKIIQGEQNIFTKTSQIIDLITPMILYPDTKQKKLWTS